MTTEVKQDTVKCANKWCNNQVVPVGPRTFCEECHANYLVGEMAEKINVLAYWGEVPTELQAKLDEARGHLKEGKYRRAIGACQRLRNLLVKPEVEEGIAAIEVGFLSPAASLVYAEVVDLSEADNYRACVDKLEKLQLIQQAEAALLEAEPQDLNVLDHLYLVDARKEYDRGNYEEVLRLLDGWGEARMRFSITNKAKRPRGRKDTRRQDYDNNWRRRLRAQAG